MRYKGKVYRPPSEAYSLIVQVTYGCSHNGCAFCDMYDDKHFAIRPMEEVREDFEMARRVYKKVERVFLADGDALMRKTEELSQILGLIYGLFPECQRVTCYASPTSLQIKSEEDLRLLRSQGLTMVYMGLESGCDEVLYLSLIHIWTISRRSTHGCVFRPRSRTAIIVSTAQMCWKIRRRRRRRSGRRRRFFSGICCGSSTISPKEDMNNDR